MSDLIPRRWRRDPSRFAESPFAGFDADVSSLFDRMFGAGLPAAAGGTAFPNVELSDHGDVLRVTAELPGIAEADVEVSLENGVLSIAGEKRSETEDKDKRYTERTYGRFSRSMTLPADVDEAKASAGFKDGVLTITLPKREEARARSRKIPISGA